jgi:ankyrin repeat protein
MPILLQKVFLFSIIFCVFLGPVLAQNKEDGASEIIQAVKNNSLAEVNKLIKKGMELEAQDDQARTPLFWAAYKGYLEIVRALLDAGANVHAPDKIEGYMPLHMAAGGGFVEIGQDLIAHGANVNAKGIKGYTPLHIAVIRIQRAFAELLIKKGANVNAQVGPVVARSSALDFAKLKKDKAMIELLSSNGGKSAKGF